MKKSIRFLSIFMTIAILLCVQLLPVSAALPPHRYGDANEDGSVDITDATHIQRHLAKYFELGDFERFAADVDNDGNVSIFDATTIQMKLAHLIDEFPAGDDYYIDIYAKALTYDYSSGKAMVGVPVTFEAIASGGPGTLMYEFYIDDEVVQESSSDSTFVHTFTQKGIYRIGFTVTSAVGMTMTHSIDYEVVEPYDTTGMVSIQSIYHKGFYTYNPEFEVIASDEGDHPYEYKFELYMVGYATNGESIFETLNLVEVQDFSQSNSFTIKSNIENGCDYQLTAYVKDNSGYEVSEIYKFTYELPAPA